MPQPARHLRGATAEHPVVHPPHVRAAAMELIAEGVNDCEISRRLGIPRGTIRDWRRPTYVPLGTRQKEFCPRCWRETRPIRSTPENYALLLGLYLGDGYISRHARTFRLRVALDAKYPRIIRASRELLGVTFPENPVGLIEAHAGKMFYVSVYSQHLPCLLPQHGTGVKHRRSVALEAWQERLIDAAPFAFLRGCIWSDGCVFINRTDVYREQPYEYLSYQFSNMSRDIVDLFVSTCRKVGVFTRLNQNRKGLWNVRINRRSSVALMLEHVGLKD